MNDISLALRSNRGMRRGVSLRRGAFNLERGAAGLGRGRGTGAFAHGSREDVCGAGSAGRQNAGSVRRRGERSSLR